MNQIDEFYKVKETYEVTKEMSKKYHSFYSAELKGDLANDWEITILLDNSLFANTKTDERWEIYKAIQEFLLDNRNKIKDHVVKRLEERMEEARYKVLKDLKLIKGVKL